MKLIANEKKIAMTEDSYMNVDEVNAQVRESLDKMTMHLAISPRFQTWPNSIKTGESHFN